jgi:hypothetical protein
VTRKLSVSLLRFSCAASTGLALSLFGSGFSTAGSRYVREKLPEQTSSRYGDRAIPLLGSALFATTLWSMPARGAGVRPHLGFCTAHAPAWCCAVWEKARSYARWADCGASA